MKKYNSVLMIIIIISIVFVSFLIQKNDTAYDDLGIYDTKSQQTIKIGDSKEQIEKYVGTSKSNDAFKCTYGGMCNPSLYKSGAKELTVVYNRQEKAKEFILKPCWNKKHSRFCLSSGIDIYCNVRQEGVEHALPDTGCFSQSFSLSAKTCDSPPAPCRTKILQKTSRWRVRAV